MKIRALLLSCSFFLACPVVEEPKPDGGASPPVVTSVSPTTGSVQGGTPITINGTNFADGATATMGTNALVNLTVQSSTRIVGTTPAAASTGTVSVTVTNPGGRSSTLNNAFTYTGTPSSSATLLTGNVTATVPANVSVGLSVLVPGVTPGTGQGAGVQVQVGLGASLASPFNPDAYDWSVAAYSGDDGDSDIYAHTFNFDEAGTHVAVARFSVDNGATWTLAAGSTAITINAVASVDWCKLGGTTVEAPPSITLRGAQPGPTIYAQVFKAGVTEGVGAGAGVVGELGYGAPGSDPATWAWAAASYNVDIGNNDEFHAVLPNPGLGMYQFAFRFKTGDLDWAYCDADGLDEGGFTHDQAGSLTVIEPFIDSCIFQHPAAMITNEGAPGASAYGRVYVQGLTEAAGPAANLEGELGYGASQDPTDGTWTWSSPAGFNLDDGSGGEEYQQAIVGPAPGAYFLAWRFRVEGSEWLYCDLDGSTNGLQAAQLPTLDAQPSTTAPTEVDWCKLGGASLEAPPQVALRGTQSGPVVYGQVFKAGVTNGAGAGAGIEGALGYGAEGTDPATWSWSAAVYNVDNGNNDEFQATLPNPGTGLYKFAFRFRVGAGDWSYCDADGLAQDGFTEAQAGTLTVTPFDIDNCHFQHPAAFSTYTGGQTEPLYGQVFAEGVTNELTADPLLHAQVGYGANAADYDTAWTWVDASWANNVGDIDEYSATLTAPAPGTYYSAYRFRYDQGAWRYCDLNGNDFNTDQLAVMTVNAAQLTCRLGDVSAFTLQSGFPLTIEAHTQVLGSSETPQVEVGIGPPDNASLSGLWGWAPAPFTGESDGGKTFEATTFPAYTGERAVAARASLDGGEWVYCDLDGSDVGGHTIEQQYNVLVQPHTDFGYCNLQHPPTIEAGSADLIYGQVYLDGVTPDAGAPIIAQVGFGAEEADPGFAWSWSGADFNTTVGNNNEYQAPLPSATPVGTRYAFRFTVDGGVWCYGDLNGSTIDGFTGSQLGTVVAP